MVNRGELLIGLVALVAWALGTAALVVGGVRALGNATGLQVRTVRGVAEGGAFDGATARAVLHPGVGVGPEREGQGADPGRSRCRRNPGVALDGSIGRGAGAWGDPLLGHCEAQLRPDLPLVGHVGTSKQLGE